MESILAYVSRRLQEVGQSEWGLIVKRTGIPKSRPRKLAWERTNATINTLEPVYRYFLERDYGTSKLPHECKPITKR